MLSLCVVLQYGFRPNWVFISIVFPDRYKSLDLSDDIVEEDEEEFLKSFSQSLTLSKQVCVVHTNA
jgi:hypothetical protein